MAEFPAMPLFTDAYLGDTTHLTTIEHGAYLLLLMVAWRRADGCLPDDDRLLARYTRLTRSQWLRMRPTIEAFFTVENGTLVQRRLRDERNHVRQVRESQSANGRASALKRKGRHSTKRQPIVNEASTPSPSPSPKVEERDAKASPKKIGSRLPDPFDMPVEWKRWAANKGMDISDVAHESTVFTRYWQAKAGKDATKLDWFKTWQNWIDRKLKESPHGSRRRDEHPLGRTGAAVDDVLRSPGSADY